MDALHETTMKIRVFSFPLRWARLLRSHSRAKADLRYPAKGLTTLHVVSGFAVIDVRRLRERL